MTREKVDALKNAAGRAQRGEISSEQAFREIEKIHPSLSASVPKTPDGAINWDRFLAILAILHAFWGSYSSDADVQAALKESRNQTELSQQMLSEQQAQNAYLRELVTKTAMPPQAQAQTRGRRVPEIVHGMTNLNIIDRIT